MENKEMILNKSRSIVMTKYEANTVENRMYNYILYLAQKKKNSDGIYSCELVREEIYDNIIKNKTEQTKENIDKILEKLKSTSLVFWDKRDFKDIKKDYNLLVGTEYIVQDDKWIIKLPEEIYKHLNYYMPNREEREKIETKIKNNKNELTEEEINELRKELENYKKNYAPVDLQITSTFKSSYTQNMYEILRLWSRFNEERVHKFSLEEIRFKLGLKENEYTRYSNLKQRVLNVAIDELQKKANMIIKIEEIKTGRKVSHLQISVIDKEPKVYFRNEKITELKNKDISMLDKAIQEEIEHEIKVIEDNSQRYTQEVFLIQIAKLKKLINNEISKTKEVEKYFDNVTYDKFKIEFKINLTIENNKIIILDCVDKTLYNTNNNKICSKNYEYFKTIISQNIGKITYEESNYAPIDIEESYNFIDDIKEVAVSDIESDKQLKEEKNISSILPSKEVVKEDMNIEELICIEKIKEYLSIKTDSIKYKTWLEKGVKNSSIKNSTLIFPVDGFVLEIIKRDYIDIIYEAINLCNIKEVEFITNK